MYKIANTKQELNDCFKVRIDVFVEEQHVPLENELDEFEDSATHIIMYDDHDTPIATARYRPYHGKAKIERVAVIKSMRMHGIGRTLMQYIEETIKNEGYTRATLNGQIQAQPFYESLGYQPHGTTFMEEGIEHIEMQKQI